VGPRPISTRASISLAVAAGYLSIAPVVLHLRNRYSSTAYIDLFAVAGLTVVVIGSIGAASKAAVVPAFSTLYRAVVLGLWQTLVPAAVWLLGTAWAARRDGPTAA
jgi:hypothetical protein